MPYALFSNDAKLSKAYPTEADVWKHARLSGLVVDVATEEDKPAPRPVLDNDYEIRPCRPDPQEDPAKNQADAEREAELDFQLSSGLGRRHRQRGLLGGERHTGLLAVQPPYRASDLEHLTRRTRGVLHKCDLIGCEHKGF
jgi:hypothetical protein